MDVKGTVHEVSQVITVSDKFKKRELILTIAENPQYPETVKFECVQDKVDLLDGLRGGDEVEVFFNLRGRPWTDKEGKTSYFNTLAIWRINKLGAGASKPAQEYSAPADVSSAPEDDDLPF